MWVVSVYMYVTFSCIRRSTALNIPVCEYGMPFHLRVSSFSQQCTVVFSAQIFHFLMSLLHYLVWVIWVRDGKDGLMKRGNVLSPLCAYPLGTCGTGMQVHALHLCLQVRPLWEFSLNLSGHFTIEMSTSTLPMPGLCPRAPGIPTYDWAYETIKSSAIKKNQNSSSASFPYHWSS